MSTNKITNSISGQRSFKKFITVLSLLFLWGNGWGQTAYNLASGDKTWNFSDIANWTNNFAAGVDALNWGAVAINATGTIPDGVKTTVSSATFTTSSSGGVQKGTQNIYLLSTGTTSNGNSVAIDLFLNYTNRTVGTLSFDYACVFNGTGDRGSSLKVYTSTNGTTWTELTAASISFVNNIAASGTKSSIILPSSFSGSSTARIRFYQYADNVGTTGSRPKISLDNINITSTSSNYSVTFNANGGSGTMADQSASTATALTTNAFTRTGYTFAGWSTTAGGSVAYANGDSYAFSSSTTLYAQWTANTLSVTYNTQGGSAIANGSTTTGGSIASSPGTPTKTGYTFNGWFAAASGGSAISFAYTHGQTSNFTLYAQWTANSLSITYDSQGGSAIANGSTTTGGSIATSPGTPTKTGYTFNGWFAAAIGGSAISFAYTHGQTSNFTLYAQWTANTLSVTYNSQGGSTITSGSTTTGGSIASSPGTPTKAGYTFNGWFIAASGGSAISFAYAHGQTSNFTLYAQWTANNNTLSFDGNGSTSGTTSDQTIASNASATLTTNGFAKTGYTFAGWSTTASGSVMYADGANYTMGTGNATLYAIWTANNNTLTFDGNGSTSGSTASQTIASNASAMLTSNGFFKSGYIFSGWSTILGGSVAYANGASYTMGTSDVTLYAVWALVTTPTITYGGSLSSVNTTYGTASSSPTSFSVSGINLTNDISINAPNGYEIAVESGTYASSQSLTQINGEVANTTINVRLAANTAAGTYSGDIVLTSTGATTVNVATVSSTVSEKALTITGLSATDKNWDGTTSVTVNGIGAEAYSGLVLSESFSIVTSGAISFVFSSANAGTAIPLTQTNTYSAPSTNYSITQPTLSANITAISPSAPSITSITPGNGQLSVDFTEPTSTGGSAITNYEYSSDNGSTWTLRNPSSTSTPLLISGLSNGTTYDVQIRAVNSIGSGTASASMQGTPVAPAILTISSNIFPSSFSTVYGTASSSQSFTLSGSGLTGGITMTPAAGFELSQTSGGTTGFATSQTITPSSGTISSTILYVRIAATTQVGNYNAQSTSVSGGGATTQTIASSASGNVVSQKALTISGLTGTNKEYDGSTIATFSGTASYDGLVNGESFSVSGTPSATFNTASVGTNKPITLIGSYSAPSANYSLTQPTLSANITTKALTVSGASAANKIYNGTTTAVISGGTLVGVVSPEVITLTQAGNFVSANAGTGISVTGNFSISGTTSSNYTLSQPSGLSANITQASQTITFNALSNQVLGAADFNPGATLSPSSGLTITYTSSNPAVATIVNGNIHLVAGGTTIITASQAGNGNYAAASDVSRNLTVKQIIAAWDFTGNNTATSTVTASSYDANLVSSGINITRGSGAAASAAGNSFRTTGFQNNGISTLNTDYFQITFTASPCFKLSLTSIDAKFNGTATFYASPGVTSQFAYSLDGTNFTLIGNPITSTSTSLTMPQVDLSSNTALQNISAGTTVTIRYYASGQTTTGGWGFYSSAAGDYGLSIGGTLSAAPISAPTAANQSFCSSPSPTVSNLTATGSSIKWYAASSGGSALSTSTGLTNNATLYASQTVTGCESVSRASSTITFTADNTASAASSSPTLCINTALTDITHTTTGATGIGTATGLPAGVTAAWASNTITISGTPTASGNFSYSIPLTGGCGSVNATGTINVSATNTVGAASSSPTLCINTALTDITYTTTGASGIGTATGLPAGVTAAWASNTITISGTPTASGNFSYSIPLTGGCGSVNATGIINVSANNTVGAASSSPSLSINTALTDITHATTGATGIGSATGLPAGVSATWASNTITISGTPTASGNFSYSIPLTGGCTSINATGTINVIADNTASNASSSPTLCMNTALTDITHTTTGATGIGTATGLPAGVTAAWASNTITISGTPTASGNFSYSIPLTGGSGSVNATGTINVLSDNTVGAASSSPILCINTLLTDITHTTTVATGIGSATGLPAGVTAAWASNTITISGTPTASGNFSYSIPLTGGCTNVNATGTITVLVDNTAGAASSSPSLNINTALTDITHTTTGATGIGTATGLPAGVTAAWASNTITISGTPTASGNFNYSIPLTGGCTSVNATGTINVTADNTASTASSSPSLCINSALTDITHTTTGATGIGTATGLPAGVTAAWASNTITISGTPTASGNFSYSIPLTGGSGSVNATGTITVFVVNTAGAASSSPSLNINTALTDITHSTTGSTGIGTATGLPAGVTAAWASNTVTISGTPIASGTFSYAIPLTGGCASVNATGTINVIADNTASAASSSPNVCINTALTDITHTTTGATGIGSATGLPAGVTAVWASNTINISGTPTASGNFSYSIPLTGGSGSVNATGTINVSADNTVGAASSSPSLSINTPLTAITHTTTGATGIGSATGLPAGVTAVWASNTITISGTPTASGNFNYSIPLTGGCTSVNATGTINVTADNTASTASSTPTLCINTALTDITHTTTGATGIGTATGLPAGVTAAWASNTITISGTPTASGNFSYSISLSGGSGSVNATGTINVSANNTAGAASSSPSLSINTALTAITHTTTGATGIGTATGLPAGVTAAWASNSITLSGTPTASGTFSYSIPLTGGCASVNATGTINVVVACSTDFNHDGITDVNDFLIFAGAFGNTNVAATPTDINSDGITDVNDFLVFSGAFNEVCN